MKKVLIISHCPLDKENNMGRTIYELFENYDKSKIAHLSFSNLKSNFEICHNFFQVSDKAMLKSFFTRKGISGNIFNKSKLIEEKEKSESFNKKIKSLFAKPNLGRLLRDSIYQYSVNPSKKLLSWIEDFQPESIFFLPGTYLYSLLFVMKIAKKYSLPLNTYIVDDFYSVNDFGWFGLFHHRKFKNALSLLLRSSKNTFYISKNNLILYEKIFHISGTILHVPTPIKTISKTDYDKNRFVYMGNISLGRIDSIIDIAKILQQINFRAYIEIHSKVIKKRERKKLSKYKNIRIGSFLDYDLSNQLIVNSAVALNCESFMKKYRRRIVCSFSTKIPTIMSLGTIMLAYGPKGLPSIDYVQDNKCGLHANNLADLECVLQKYFRNEINVDLLLANAKETLEKNHNKQKTCALLWEKI